jgi:hypothetical protein
MPDEPNLEWRCRRYMDGDWMCQSSENRCGAKSSNGYLCTKQKGHLGDHVACCSGCEESKHNVVVWGNKMRKPRKKKTNVISRIDNGEERNLTIDL